MCYFFLIYFVDYHTRIIPIKSAFQQFCGFRELDFFKVLSCFFPIDEKHKFCIWQFREHSSQVSNLKVKWLQRNSFLEHFSNWVCMLNIVLSWWPSWITDLYKKNITSVRYYILILHVQFAFSGKNTLCILSKGLMLNYVMRWWSTWNSNKVHQWNIPTKFVSIWPSTFIRKDINEW